MKTHVRQHSRGHTFNDADLKRHELHLEQQAFNKWGNDFFPKTKQEKKYFKKFNEAQKEIQIQASSKIKKIQQNNWEKQKRLRHSNEMKLQNIRNDIITKRINYGMTPSVAVEITDTELNVIRRQTGVIDYNNHEIITKEQEDRFGRKATPVKDNKLYKYLVSYFDLKLNNPNSFLDDPRMEDEK